MIPFLKKLPMQLLIDVKFLVYVVYVSKRDGVWHIGSYGIISFYFILTKDFLYTSWLNENHYNLGQAVIK